MTDIEFRIEEIKEEIRKINAEKQRLEEELRELTLRNNTKKILSMVDDVSTDNSMRVFLDKDRRTTEIMSKFFNSERRFLILQDMFKIGAPFVRVSLIVVKPQKGIRYIDDKLTITDLKKLEGEFLPVSDSTFFAREAVGRKRQLMIELKMLLHKVRSCTVPVPFNMPLRLGAQTFANQTGYGSEYIGNKKVVQGTLYGETTGFFIIGAVKVDYD